MVSFGLYRLKVECIDTAEIDAKVTWVQTGFYKGRHTASVAKMMLGNLIELQFGAGRNWPLGAALSITLLSIVMIALLVYVRNIQNDSDGLR